MPLAAFQNRKKELREKLRCTLKTRERKEINEKCKKERERKRERKRERER